MLILYKLGFKEEKISPFELRLFEYLSIMWLWNWGTKINEIPQYLPEVHSLRSKDLRQTIGS